MSPREWFLVLLLYLKAWVSGVGFVWFSVEISGKSQLTNKQQNKKSTKLWSWMKGCVLALFHSPPFSFFASHSSICVILCFMLFSMVIFAEPSHFALYYICLYPSPRAARSFIFVHSPRLPLSALPSGPSRGVWECFCLHSAAKKPHKPTNLPNKTK